MKVTVHEPPDRAQVSGEGRRAPSLLMVTEPVGTMGVPTSVSVTLTKHVADWPTLSGNVQPIRVIVERLLTVMLVEPELLL